MNTLIDGRRLFILSILLSFSCQHSNPSQLSARVVRQVLIRLAAFNYRVRVRGLSYGRYQENSAGSYSIFLLFGSCLQIFSVGAVLSHLIIKL